jgi:hypothetical protein
LVDEQKKIETRKKSKEEKLAKQKSEDKELEKFIKDDND